MTAKNLVKRFYFQLMLGVFGLSLIFVLPSAERAGDRLQYFIPLVGLACSFEADEMASYASRYAVGLGSVHAAKNLFPDASFAVRPNGGDHGFPSGHTFSAAYGASYVVRKCAQRVPYLGPIAAIGAAFTGATRVDAEKHTAWQVFWALTWAVVMDLGFRKYITYARFKAWLTKRRKLD